MIKLCISRRLTGFPSIQWSLSPSVDQTLEPECFLTTHLFAKLTTVDALVLVSGFDGLSSSWWYLSSLSSRKGAFIENWKRESLGTNMSTFEEKILISRFLNILMSLICSLKCCLGRICLRLMFFLFWFFLINVWILSLLDWIHFLVYFFIFLRVWIIGIIIQFTIYWMTASTVYLNFCLIY